jgi:hypothetical protein
VEIAGQWAELTRSLSPDWVDAAVRLDLEAGEPVERAAALLGPLQPSAAGGALTFRVAKDGSGPSPEMVRNLLARLDDEPIHGRLEVISSTAQPAREPERVLTLVESWDRELEKLPADWSDLLCEVELDSSDYLERGALRMAPLNPRRDENRLSFLFRCASRFGYGASPGMARRCLARCDEDGIRGRVRTLWALSDSRAVQTQGPVWHLKGKTV